MSVIVYQYARFRGRARRKGRTGALVRARGRPAPQFAAGARGESETRRRCGVQHVAPDRCRIALLGDRSVELADRLGDRLVARGDVAAARRHDLGTEVRAECFEVGGLQAPTRLADRRLTRLGWL